MLSHFKNYLSSSWAGKIVKGGKHLARALAMLAIEAVFALMFGGKAAFKAVKSGAKSIAKNGVKASLKSGAKLAKTTAKNGLKSGVQGAKRFKRIVGAGTQRAGKNLAKGGKFMVSGVRKGAMKGAKSLKSVVKNLSKKLKFDKYRFTLKGRKFKLEGHLNPWVLFANGELDYVDSKDLNKAKVGDKVNVSGRGDGFVVGSKNVSKNGKKAKSIDDLSDKDKISKYIDKLKKLSNSQRQDEFSQLFGKRLNSRISAIYGGQTTVELRKGIKELGEMLPRLFQAHHIIPRELLKEFDVFFKKINFNIENGKINGIMLPPNQKILDEFVEEMAKKGKLPDTETFLKRAFHEGSHPKYTNRVRERIAVLSNQVRNIDNLKPEVAKYYSDKLNSIIKSFEINLKTGVETLD